MGWAGLIWEWLRLWREVGGFCLKVEVFDRKIDGLGPQSGREIAGC